MTNLFIINLRNMKKLLLYVWGLLFCLGMQAGGERETVLLRDGWRFTRADDASFGGVQVDDGKWERVSVPHDWAISGPFDANNDRQFMAIEQDGQKEAQNQSGRTGGLPFVGVGWYRLHFDVPGFGTGKRVVLIDDSIVRGTTSHQIVRMLRDAGAKEVHVKVSAPPFLHPCYFGTDIPSEEQLIAHNRTVDQICELIGADSLSYLRMERLYEMAEGLPICTACFNGEYPIDPPKEDIRGEYTR